MQIFLKLATLAFVLLLTDASIAAPLPGIGGSRFSGGASRTRAGSKTKYGSSRLAGGSSGLDTSSPGLARDHSLPPGMSAAHAAFLREAGVKPNGLGQLLYAPRKNSPYYEKQMREWEKSLPKNQELEHVEWQPDPDRRAKWIEKTSSTRKIPQGQRAGKANEKKEWNKKPWGKIGSGSKAFKAKDESRGGMPVRSGDSNVNEYLYDPASERDEMEAMNPAKANTSPKAANQGKPDKPKTSLGSKLLSKVFGKPNKVAPEGGKPGEANTSPEEPELVNKVVKAPHAEHWAKEIAKNHGPNNPMNPAGEGLGPKVPDTTTSEAGDKPESMIAAGVLRVTPQ
ncbi:hypothetical protein JDV02_010617 [Purpureocillium takamizusanense]|uniref:Uncharacterized protein n=1 Tax=Purpureocillium takamizusanense TaxID=2060973 RepID=A0A9Q8QQZ5_9HYPO|nr:uncharacterized protein JDV02_010617 [Purpureocillium takamizusanense]UNI24898.1 hypothetical protein JDV02_010617 [Purpureocillium takamizusanense]